MPAPGEAEGTGSAGSLVMVAATLLRRWRALVVVPLVCSAVALAWTVLSQQYVARSSFRPESGSGQGAPITALAAQFGVTLTPGEAAISLDFYRKLVRSRPILSAVLTTPYRVSTGPERSDSLVGTLLQLYDVRGKSEADRLDRGYKRLLRDVTVDLDRPAGTIDIATVAPWSDLAAQINRRILGLVNEFNVKTRSSGAAARREFAHQRMIEAGAELRTAEDDVLVFTERNRRYQDSPELVFARDRLVRQVSLRQQVYTTLATAYEQARVDAVKDTPVITVIEQPEGSVERSGRLGANALLAALFGFIVAAGAVFVVEQLAFERRTRPELSAELDRLTLPWRRTVRGPRG